MYRVQTLVSLNNNTYVYPTALDQFSHENSPLEDNDIVQCSADTTIVQQLLANLTIKPDLVTILENSDDKQITGLTAEQAVLKRCDQSKPLPFTTCFPRTVLKNCHKIGEGVYGEVFLYKNQSGGTSVIKIIPIEGHQIVNGERQKKYEEIITEIAIAQELSNLRANPRNRTSGFNELKTVRCVYGRYPALLLDKWDLYDENCKSENDSPIIFNENQHYIVLELENGGTDLEAYRFDNAKQAYSIFEQVACTLAVAEAELEFEHRDLHWGNVLVSSVDWDTKLTFVLNGNVIEIPSHGTKACIIDFTLSRITLNDIYVYNDLSQDPDLFTAHGDYQFEVYRLMQDANSNMWHKFEPYSNILWLNYLLHKMITALKYKSPHMKMHQVYIDKMKILKQKICLFRSAQEFVKSLSKTSRD